MSKTTEGSYEVIASEGAKLTVREQTGVKLTVTITFVEEGVIHWQPEGQHVMVLRRQ